MTIGCDGYIIGIKTKEGRGSVLRELIWEIPDHIYVDRLHLSDGESRRRTQWLS